MNFFGWKNPIRYSYVCMTQNNTYLSGVFSTLSLYFVWWLQAHIFHVRKCVSICSELTLTKINKLSDANKIYHSSFDHIDLDRCFIGPAIGYSSFDCTVRLSRRSASFFLKLFTEFWLLVKLVMQLFYANFAAPFTSPHPPGRPLREPSMSRRLLKLKHVLRVTARVSIGRGRWKWKINVRLVMIQGYSSETTVSSSEFFNIFFLFLIDLFDLKFVWMRKYNKR